jgi:hypothetical protein
MIQLVQHGSEIETAPIIKKIQLKELILELKFHSKDNNLKNENLQ